MQSSLVAVIVGSSRMNGYSQALEIKTKIYDPDNEDDPQGRLVISFTCTNLITDSTCYDIYGKELLLNSTDSSQYFPAKSLEPYQSYSFKLEVSDLDSTRTSTATAIIVIVELDLPVLNMDYPIRYVNERINLNETPPN